MRETPTCAICGEPMPPGEEMFKYHGLSGPCPKPPKAKEASTHVTIPRVQYEAYRAAARAVQYIAANDYPTQMMIDCPHDMSLEDFAAQDALAALRAAGIPEETKP